MISWYLLAVIASLSFGIQNFLFKVSAEKKCNTAWTTFSHMVVVAIIAIIFFFVTGEKVLSISLLLFIAFLDAVTYFLTTVGRIEALKHIPAGVTFPIIRLSVVPIVLFSVIYFKDKLSLLNILGIVLAVLVIFLLIEKKSRIKIKNFRKGIFLLIIALIFSAATTIVVKFAAVMLGTMAFIAVSYIFTTFMSLAMVKKMQGKNVDPSKKNAIIIGFFIGILNFFAFYVLLKALSVGPLSIVGTVNAMYFVIPIILSILIYKEEINLRRILAIIFTIVAFILLGL